MILQKMLQEDPITESTFEIIDQKNRDLGHVESLSNLKPMLPKANTTTPTSGNLLSNIKPPAALPDFTLWSTPVPVGESINTQIPVDVQAPTEPVLSQPSFVPSVPTIPSVSSTMSSFQTSVPFHLTARNPTVAPQIVPGTEFSAAIPPSKGIQYGPTHQTELQNQGPSTGFMGLVKGAFSGGVLSKMAEKAKSSVDSIITTLDPQMSEYIYSGGDIEVTVTSKNEEVVGAVREACHLVLGKAWVNGVDLNLPPKPSQAIGFEDGMRRAEDKIEYSLKYRSLPTIAIENVLLEQHKNWFDLSLLVLKDAERQITIQTFSQAIPVPVDEFLKEVEREQPDCTSMSVEEKLALYLQIHPNWQTLFAGVSRKEVLLMAAKVLIGVYKSKLV